jgi:hypothetical protein
MPRYYLKIDDFSGLATIYDGDRVMARDVGKTDADLIVACLNECWRGLEARERQR